MHATERRRAAVQRIWSAAVAAANPSEVVAAAVRLQPDGGVLVGEIALPDRPIWAIAIGKAASSMEAGLRDAVGARLVGSIVVGKGPDTAIVAQQVPTRHYLRGSHPVPDQRSLDAGAAVLAFAEAIPAGDAVVCLISGGGSALVEVLRDGIDLAELQGVTRDLLASGATIQEMNAVRGRLSQIKAGGLRQALAHTHAVSLVISDVLGNDPASIASGLTAEPSSLRAEDVLARYGVACVLPDASVKRNDVDHEIVIVADVTTAIDAAVVAAQAEGHAPWVLLPDLDGEARFVGSLLGGIVRAAALDDASDPRCFIAGGETTVTIRNTPDGPGGRNCEAALAAALRIAGADVTLAFLATDGDDGTTGAAGAIVDGTTVPAQLRRRAEAALSAHEAYGFLRERGALWSPGISGTNVNDLVIGLTGRV